METMIAVGATDTHKQFFVWIKKEKYAIDRLKKELLPGENLKSAWTSRWRDSGSAYTNILGSGNPVFDFAKDLRDKFLKKSKNNSPKPRRQWRNPVIQAPQKSEGFKMFSVKEA